MCNKNKNAKERFRHREAIMKGGCGVLSFFLLKQRSCSLEKIQRMGFQRAGPCHVRAGRRNEEKSPMRAERNSQRSGNR